MVGRVTQRLIVGIVDENRPAAGGVARVDVAPAIADHPALRQIDVQFFGGAEQHSRLWFAAIAVGSTLAGMIADLDSIQSDPLTQVFMERFHGGLGQSTAADVWLVRGDDEKETGLLQPGARFDDAWENLEFLQHRRRVGLAVTGEGAVDDAIAVQEDGPPHFVPSHLVRFTFNFGCETKRCHTTAWKASECGVT